MKKLITVIALVFCGSSLFSQIYTPTIPTVYGSNNNRVKSLFVLGVPSKDTTTNTSDTSAQIFYRIIDSTFWGWSQAKGFFKVAKSGDAYSRTEADSIAALKVNLKDSGVVYVTPSKLGAKQDTSHKDTSNIIQLGSGTRLIYADGVSSNIYAKTLNAGSNVTITPNTDSSLTISASVGGSVGNADSLNHVVGSSYLLKTDTAAMLNPYLRKIDTTGKWLSPGTASITYVPQTTTVNGHALSSNVTLTKSDVGLSNVDNTSDISKPISTAVQNALNLKMNYTDTASALSHYLNDAGYGLTKSGQIVILDSSKYATALNSGILKNTDWSKFTNKTDSVSLNAGGDSIIVIKNSSRLAYKLPTGTVTSVGLTMPGVLFNSSVTGSPVTTSGTLSPSLISQSPYTLFGNNTSGSATPTFFTNPYIDSLKRNYDSVFLKINGAWAFAFRDNHTPALTTLTDGATITWDYPTQTREAKVTLAGNRTLSITNLPSGKVAYLTLEVIQDATGSRTLTLPSGTKVINGGAGASTLTTTASAIDILSFRWNGTTLFCTYGKNYN